ncbi:phosphopantothenate--cysteine ligase (ATP) [Malassezia sp. CBS 17886]|nr:phosphopantothenate--cysteine ligase (ATP) [Malassezia sp. CBS 17886]
MAEAHVWTPERFFAEYREPAGGATYVDKARGFCTRHYAEARKVALVTSGGTTVPLEKNVVRYLDNFSAGTRGAASAEYLLDAGYAVIFLSRQHSQFPYTRRYSHTTNPFFDFLEEPSTDGSPIRVQESETATLLPVLQSYHEACKSGRLLTIPFVTVIEYLFLLRSVSREMRVLGPSAMLYLAAAVSDYFIPQSRIAEHKIQSDNGALSLVMEQVPKVLGTLVQEWAPDAFVVSFKLETQDELVVPKAEKSLRQYGHQLVIGNHLQKRKHEVFFVEHMSRTRSGTPPGAFEHTRICVPGGYVDGVPPSREIEQDIIESLVARHDAWIAQCGRHTGA